MHRTLRKGNQESDEPYYADTYIDFHDTTQMAYSSIARAREFYCVKTENGEWNLTLRPYCLDNMRKLLKHARSIREKGWPNTKLQFLRSACFQSPRLLYQQFLRTMAARRVTSDQRNALIEALCDFDSNPLDWYWQWEGRRDNALVDLLEVISFLAKERS